MAHYSFPLLQDRELVHCFNDQMGVAATVELLNKPTPEFVYHLYETLVAALMGMTREELQQPVFAATDELEFPALHDDSIPARAFQEALAKLLLAAGVKDFSLRDLYKPEAATLRRNLSAIINFAKFREEKLVQQTEQQEHCEALILAKEAAEAEAAALQATLAELQAAAAAEVPEVAAVEAETAAVFAENQSLNKAQSALGGEVRALKQQANALTDEASQLRYKLSQARGAGEDLRAQIVQSPHKLQAQLEEISAAVERERGALLDAERRSRDLAQRLDAVSKVERDVAKAEAVMGEAEAEVARKKEVSRRVKALRAEVAAAEHEAGQLEAQHQHLKRQQAALAERIHRLEAQQEVKRQAAEGRVEEALRNKEAIAADNAAAVAKLAENEAMIRAMRDRIAELRGAHEAQVAGVLAQYEGLRAAVAQYHAEMEDAMGDPTGGSGPTPGREGEGGPRAGRPVNVR